MNDKLPFDSLSCGSRMWCETFFGELHLLLTCSLTNQDLGSNFYFFSWSVPKYFLRRVLQWMLWTRTRTLRCITPLAMVWRGAWIFCWRTEPLCKLNLLILVRFASCDHIFFFFVHSLTVSNCIAAPSKTWMARRPLTLRSSTTRTRFSGCWKRMPSCRSPLLFSWAHEQFSSRIIIL